MSYNPEQPYEDEAKIENALAELQEKNYDELWGDLKHAETCKDFIHDFYYDRESDKFKELLVSIFENVATTRINVMEAPYDNRNAIKAECYNQIVRSISELLDVEAKRLAKIDVEWGDDGFKGGGF